MRKPCIEAGCPNLTGHGSRCDWHRRQFERQRKASGATGARGSTRAWRKLRDKLAKAFGNRCARCAEPLEDGWQLHHVNGDATDDREDNLEPLCAKCHGEVHEIARKTGLNISAAGLTPTSGVFPAAGGSGINIASPLWRDDS